MNKPALLVTLALILITNLSSCMTTKQSSISLDIESNAWEIFTTQILGPGVQPAKSDFVSQSGNYSLKSSLVGPGRGRSELFVDLNVAFLTDRYLEFSIYFPKDFPEPTFSHSGNTGWMVISQWWQRDHDNTNTSPPLGIHLDHKNDQVMQLGVYVKNSYTRAGAALTDNGKLLVKELIKFEKGQWYDIATEVFFDPYNSTGNGRVKVWVNDQLVFHFKGPVGYQNWESVQRTYARIGLYRSSTWKPDTSAYYDNIYYGQHVSPPHVK